MKRDVQLALIEGARDKAVGVLAASVVAGTNADLIRAVAPLYLRGAVLDVTYGRGSWWRRFRPPDLVAHDLLLDGVDFRALPHDARSFDTVCFDPPYVPRHGAAAAPAALDQNFRERYGLEISRNQATLARLVDEGLAECARVARRFVLVKCCDYTTARAFHLGHVRVIDTGRALGLRVHDLVIHAAGAGPGGGATLEQKRTRRAHSYLVVFAVDRRRRAGTPAAARGGRGG